MGNTRRIKQSKKRRTVIDPGSSIYYSGDGYLHLPSFYNGLKKNNRFWWITWAFGIPTFAMIRRWWRFMFH